MSAMTDAAARIILADSDLRSVFGARATAVYNFVRVIVSKNLAWRFYVGYANWSKTPASSTDGFCIYCACFWI
jgi:hypothetical protein